MKLTVSQKNVLGFADYSCALWVILWAALRKPPEHKKVFVMTSLVVRQKTGPEMLREESTDTP